MSMHLRFAANLRKECYRYDSIADVCRGSGINRQQFNRYLSGKVIPNAATMQRMCEFLGTSEERLFLGVAQSSASSVPDGRPESPRSSCGDAVFDNLLSQLRGKSEGSLPKGLYFVYYPMPAVANLLMRSLLVVRDGDNGRKFSRVTVFPRDGKTASYLFKGRHEGIVCSNGSQLYLLGITRGSRHQMTILALESGSSSADQRFRCGLSLIRTTSEFISAATCIEKLPDSFKVRDAFRILGPVLAEDRSVDKFIVAALGGISGGQLLRSVEYHTVLSRNLAHVQSQHAPLS